MNERTPFYVHRNGDEAGVAMDCGGLIRTRLMPTELLETMAEMIGKLRDAVVEQSKGFGMPTQTGFASLIEGRIEDVCHACAGLACNAGEGWEILIAVYDEDDDEAPVLVLIEEQIDEFIRQAS